MKSGRWSQDQHCAEPWAGWWLVGNLIRVIVELSTQHDYKIPHMDHSQFLLFSPSPLNSYLLRKVVLCKGITVTSRVLCSLGWNMFMFTLFVYQYKCFLQLGLHTFNFATNLCEIMLKMVVDMWKSDWHKVQCAGPGRVGVWCDVWSVARCRNLSPPPPLCTHPVSTVSISRVQTSPEITPPSSMVWLYLLKY